MERKIGKDEVLMLTSEKECDLHAFIKSHMVLLSDLLHIY